MRAQLADELHRARAVRRPSDWKLYAHHAFQCRSPLPNFTPYAAKYADNGGAKRMQEFGAYFRHYFMRDPVAHALKHLTDGSEMMLRTVLPEKSPIFRAAKRVYYGLMTR